MIEAPTMQETLARMEQSGFLERYRAGVASSAKSAGAARLKVLAEALQWQRLKRCENHAAAEAYADKAGAIWERYERRRTAGERKEQEA